MEKLIANFNTIIDRVESRCMAVDGPVTPTLQEMREEELAELWKILQQMKIKLNNQQTDIGPSPYDLSAHPRRRKTK